jgi:hypothetical protein
MDNVLIIVDDLEAAKGSMELAKATTAAAPAR